MAEKELIGKADADKHLDRCATARNSLNQTLWASFGLFLAAESALFAAFVSQSAQIKFFIVAAAGVIISWIWHRIVVRMQAHLNYEEGVILILEDELKIPPRFSHSRKRNPESWVEETFNGSSEIRSLLIAMPTFCIGVWAICILVATLHGAGLISVPGIESPIVNVKIVK